MATPQPLTNFRKSYPIDFSLLDQHDQAVIYISEDRDDWELHLTLLNTASQPITLIDGPGETSSTNHHFALRFHPGTLAKRALDLLSSDKWKDVVKTKDWELARVPPPAPNAPVTLYLRYKGSEKTLKQNESHSIKLSGISAAPGNGSRGTQVEMIPHQLKFEGEGAAPITNSRTQYLHVTNHSGRKNIPLHVGFVGGDRVLTGAINTKLHLRITNIFKSKDVRQSTITFRAPNKKADDAGSQLVLSYDKGDDEWALSTVDPGKGGAVTVDNKRKDQQSTLNLTGVPYTEGQSSGWVIAFDKDFELKYGESFNIRISGIAVNPHPGHANLYLHYYNIPGYWEGQFVCSIEKGPLVVKHHIVGIGTEPSPTSTSKLEVAGETKTTKLTITGDASRASETPGAGIIQLGKGSLELGWDGQKEHPNGGWIQTNGGSLVINPNGNKIQIGSPKSVKVSVFGELELDGRLTLKFGVWEKVIELPSKLWRPFTEVASMMDEEYKIHLRGVLFVPANAQPGDYICRIHGHHTPNNNLLLENVTGLRSLSEWSQHTLQVVGLNAVQPGGAAGWIKVVDFKGERPKLISLDGLKFKHTT